MSITRSLALAACVAFLLGTALLSPQADAEVRRQTPPQAFSSGAMRSEQVLLDIKALLQRMDGRLARIEQDVAELKRTGTLGASPMAGARHNLRGVRGAE